MKGEPFSMEGSLDLGERTAESVVYSCDVTGDEMVRSDQEML